MATLDALQAMMQATGLPLQLNALGISHNQLPLLASEAMKQQRLLINNPVPIAEADALRASLVLITSERPLYPIVFPHGFPMLVIPPDPNML